MIAHDLDGTVFQLDFHERYVSVSILPFRTLRIDIGLLKGLIDQHSGWYAKSVAENMQLIEAYSDPDVEPDDYKRMVLGETKRYFTIFDYCGT